jgi:hypothetical protein
VWLKCRYLHFCVSKLLVRLNSKVIGSLSVYIGPPLLFGTYILKEVDRITTDIVLI